MDVNADPAVVVEGNGLLSATAIGSVEIALHPLVILNASEHFIRRRAQTGDAGMTGMCKLSPSPLFSFFLLFFSLRYIILIFTLHRVGTRARAFMLSNWRWLGPVISVQNKCTFSHHATPCGPACPPPPPHGRV